MGTWGTGLYQNDAAEDIKPLIGVLLHLPITEERVIELALPGSDGEGDDTIDGCLILADQFEKRGIHNAAIFERAIEIIASGADIERLRSLEMSQQDLAKRQRVLDELAGRLSSPRPAKERKTLKKPKPLPVSAGDLIAYPTTAKGQSINPYYSAALLDASGFEVGGWRVTQIVETGYVFDYLPWVAARISRRAYADVPTAAGIDHAAFSRGFGYGTLSPIHFKKMQMVKVGSAPVPADLVAPPRGAHTPMSVAMSDVSVSNVLMHSDYLFNI